MPVACTKDRPEDPTIAMTKTIAAVALALLVPSGAAQAGDLDLTFGLQLNRHFAADAGLVWENNTVEGSMEAAYSGLLFGAELASLPDDPPDRFQAELSFGIEVPLTEDLDFSVIYTRSYLDVSGWDSQDFTTSLSASLGEILTGGLAIVFDPDQETLETEIAVDLAPNDKWSFGLVFGVSEADDNYFGEASVGYALNENVSLEALYEDADDELGALTLSVVLELTPFGD